MTRLHIIQGGVENGDKDWLEKAASAGTPASRWNVPKTASPGDRIVMYVLGYGFFATAEITTLPKPRPNWPNRYMSGLKNIKLIKPPISLDEIRSRIPGWKWLNYPRGYTTPDEKVATRIESLIQSWAHEIDVPDIDEEAFALEGGKKLKSHFVTERSASLVRKKKDSVLRSKGRLQCEVCAFDFQKVYGEIGEDFCEVHHLRQLSERGKSMKTRLSDLAIVCSNCHRMLHRMLHSQSIVALRKLVRQ